MNIRIADKKDYQAILNIYTPYILETAFTFEEEVPSIEKFSQRLSAIQSALPLLVCEEQDIIVGYAYASDHREKSSYRWTKEVSIYIAQEHHRKGIARNLYERLFKTLKAQGFNSLLAGITIPNDPSVAFHESFGFKQIAMYQAIGFKHNKWHDVGWWELHIQDKHSNKTPKEPISVNLAIDNIAT